MVFADETLGALLALGGKVAVGQVVADRLWWRPVLGESKTERGRRGRRSMWTSFGACPVVASTELL